MTLERAIKDRENIKTNIGHWEDKLKKHQSGTTLIPMRKVLQYIDCVTINLRKLAEAHEDIYQNSDPADVPSHSTEYLALNDRLDELDHQFDTIRISLITPSTATSTTVKATTDIRLPTLDLPSFSGTMTEWMSFRDMFSAAIHNNPALSDAQKLTYLKSRLTGEAARQVKSLALSDSNYNIAWKMLNDRYQNDRELLFSILHRFINQPSIQSTSASSIRSLVDTTHESMRSLEILKLPVDKWDAILLFILFQKLDQTSKELWEQSLRNSSIPPLQDFLDFLEQRARALAAGGSKSQQQPKSQGGRVAQVHHTQSSSCKLCHGDHFTFKCSKFVALAVTERIETVKRISLCFNCLREDHLVHQCRSNSTCRVCKRKHHTLLHLNREPVPPAQADPVSAPVISNHSNDDTPVQQRLFATAVVKVRDCHDQLQPCRLFLDSGSNSHLVTENCVQRLGVGRRNLTTQITGLSSVPVGTTKGIVSLNIHPHFPSQDSLHVEALILNKITGRLPVHPCDPSVWPHIQGLELADPSFHIPADVDILLGAEHFWNILLDGKRSMPGAPVAQRSTLGWLVGGIVDSSAQLTSQVSVHYTDTDLDAQLEKFWEIESLTTKRLMTSEERACEAHFDATHSNAPSGRFVVKLPLKTPPPVLDSSRPIAVRRLKQLEARLTRQPNYQQQYIEFMREYLTLGHMVEVPEEETRQPRNQTCYIPHHYVLKESSTTTKLRVVFDASAKTPSGQSLNDGMMVGPVLQDNLIDLIMRFRKHPVAFTADIEKMYRQILVSPEHTDLQRILWREDPSQPIKEYRLLTVTDGTAAAPYLATKTLQQLAINHQDSHPIGSQIAKDDSYMDDVMSGAQTSSEAIQAKDQLMDLMAKGGFNLRKWSSNSHELLLSLPPELRETQPLLPFDEQQTVKVLGTHWCTTTDHILFKVSLPEPESLKVGGDGDLSKRKLLSEMAQIYDLPGFLAPIIITPKILMQRLWQLQIGWDDPLPTHIQQQWVIFKLNLPSIEQIRIPRCYLPMQCVRLSLVGFCDASEQAYAAVVYVRGDHPEHTRPPSVSIVASKTRVAPSKTVSLPRLELCGALLLSQLMTRTNAALKMNFDSVTAFTDSTDVLGWIQSHPSRWKTFVANRVTKIQDRLPATQWGHVRGVDNPADCASRGIPPQELKDHLLWWTGPNWLSHGDIPETGKVHLINKDFNLEEKKLVICANAVIQQNNDILCKFSSLTKLKRVSAWCLRFIHNCLVKNETDRRRGQLSTQELDKSLLNWIRVVQAESFPIEIEDLVKNKPLHCKSRIRPLNPFLDSTAVLRVGGRLRHSLLPVEQKHPILLPRHHPFTKMLISSTHLTHCHAGPQLVQSMLTQKYWIVGARDAIRHVIKKCVTCTRHRGVTLQQFMGDLPATRVTATRAFLRCGVDYAGPFVLRSISPRSKTTFKAYLAVFICFSTRAVHLELVSSLSTDAFLSTLRRFIARRGKPSDMFSDAGTNFIGAARELKEMTRSGDHNNKVTNVLANEGIQWHFNPPGAPHFGGLWEAGVKSVKHHLYRIMGTTRLTFEEMTTTLAQIESCLNSRPLTALSSDPNDLTALTPGHFLIGAPLTSAPDPDLSDLKLGRLSRWQLVQQLYQSFWKRWHNEFLTRLQQRPKWHNHSNAIKIGDLVLVKDERLPPLKWKLARVISTHPGADGVVRVVTLKTEDGEMKRPIVKLCLLPIDSKDNSSDKSDGL